MIFRGERSISNRNILLGAWKASEYLPNHLGTTKDERPKWVFGDTLLCYVQGHKEKGSFGRVYCICVLLRLGTES
jgi:hypothetical protein